MKLPCFIDIEASSLQADSYPIEVAWSDENGHISSCLINPYLYPESWTDWDPGAQAVHGLSRAYLCDHGQHPELVARKMTHDLRRKVLHSDAPDFDRYWIERLFDASGMKVPFKIGDALALLSKINPSFMQHSERADELAGGIHRAENDVRYLCELYKLNLFKP